VKARWPAWLLLPIGVVGCSTLSDREMLHHAGAFSVIEISLEMDDEETLGADALVVDPATHLVYVSGDQSDKLAIVDGIGASLFEYARLRPEGEQGGPPEGLVTTPFGGSVFVALPDFDGVPVMRYIGLEPSYVLSADAVDADKVPDDVLPRRLVVASDEDELVLLADKTWDGIGFQCLSIGSQPAAICPDPIASEFPVDMVYSPHFERLFMLSAPSTTTSRLRAFDRAGRLFTVEFTGGAARGQILVDERRGWVYVIQQDVSQVHRIPVDGGSAEALPVEAGPVEIVQARESGWLYVACRDAHRLVGLQPESGERVSYRLEGSPSGLALDEPAGYLFVALRDRPDLTVLDLESEIASVVDVFGPQGDIVVDRAERHAYVVIDGEAVSRMAY